MEKIISLVMILTLAACGQSGGGSPSAAAKNPALSDPPSEIQPSQPAIVGEPSATPSPDPTATPAVDPSPSPTPDLSATPTPTSSPTATPVETADLTYYSLARTERPVSGFQNSYTAVGNCVVYLTKTYCWDDGVWTIDFTVNNFRYGPLTYTYFGIGKTGGGAMSICHGGCPADDWMSDPTEVTASLNANLKIAGQDLVVHDADPVAHVLSAGVPTTVTCVKTDGSLNCGTFTIDLGGT